MPDEITGIADDVVEPTAPEPVAEPAAEGGEGNAPARGIADDDPAEGNGEQPAAGDEPKTDEQQKDVKPEPYELEQLEGFQIPDDNLKSFSTKCNELGLSKEQAQGILAWHKEQNDASINRVAQDEAQTLKSWDHELQADPEFGGANLKRTTADAIRCLREFDPDGSLRQILRDTKMQFNPAVIKICARVGAAMGEHGFISADGKGGEEMSLAQRFYPNM